MARTFIRGDAPLQSISDRQSAPTPTRDEAVLSVRPSFMRQIIGFLTVGAVCTASYVVLYLVMRNHIGQQTANFLASLITAVMNTGLNRSFTFNIKGKDNLSAHHAQGLLVFLFGWLLTSMSLVTLHHVSPHASATTEMVVLCAANLVATALRFTLLKVWVFSFTSRRNRKHFISDDSRHLNRSRPVVAAAAAALTVASVSEAAAADSPDPSANPTSSISVLARDTTDPPASNA